jgi:PhnB protein
MVDQLVINAQAHLVVKNGIEAIDFYKEAFQAVEQFRLIDPGDGRLGHAELLFGDTVVMLCDEYPDFGALSPETLGGSPVTIHLATSSVDLLAARAVKAGATILRAPTDQGYGERTAHVLDPYGHKWVLDESIERVHPQEMQRRWDEETSA